MSLKFTISLLLAVVLCASFSIYGLVLVTVKARTKSPVKTSFKFDFGPGKVAPGYRQVLQRDTYSKESGYGFEDASAPDPIDKWTLPASPFVTFRKPAGS